MPGFPIRVLVWNEFVQEKSNPGVTRVYPDGIHAVIAASLDARANLAVETGTLHDPEQGVSEAKLEQTDVLIWWGHKAHADVSEETVNRVQKRVLDGMGLIVLHSGHYSKIFKRLMGTSCALCWREAGERERLWVVNPGHPIAQGITECIELEHSEMYGEPFGIPQPDEQVFISWYQGGEVFRSGNCWHRGSGRVFYFSPGHETYPIYHHPLIQRVIYNAVLWAQPKGVRAAVPRKISMASTREPIETNEVRLGPV